jgi:hypothetical protein
MYIAMYKSTQIMQVSLVLCNVQQYTDFGGFLCILKCANLHRLCRILLYSIMCKITHKLDGSYLRCNVLNTQMV